MVLLLTWELCKGFIASGVLSPILDVGMGLVLASRTHVARRS